MKIRLNTLVAGPRGTFQPGRELTVGEQVTMEEAQEWLACRSATLIVEAKVERAVLPPVEHREASQPEVKKTRKGKGR